MNKKRTRRTDVNDVSFQFQIVAPLKSDACRATISSTNSQRQKISEEKKKIYEEIPFTVVDLLRSVETTRVNVTRNVA